MLRALVTGLLLTVPAGAACAQSWAEKMFAEKSVDFGTVARAAKVEHRFAIKNTQNQELHIAAVRSSCGCTQPRVEVQTAVPGEEAAIVAKFNTLSFTGQHRATVTVTIDRPQYAEVQIQVKGYVRTDVVLDPAEVNLGSVNPGQEAEKTVRLEYAGRDDWKITGVESNLPFLTAEVKEVARTGGRASYELTVRQSGDAPAGDFAEQLIVRTNDRRATQFPVAVAGRVVPALSISPNLLLLGQVQPGERVTRQLVVKGKEPFRIAKVECGDEALSFKYGEDAKAVQILSVTWTAPLQPGRSEQTITVRTDGGASANATIVGQTATPLAER